MMKAPELIDLDDPGADDLDADDLGADDPDADDPDADDPDADDPDPDPGLFIFGVDDDPTFDALTSLQVAGRFASPDEADRYALQVQAHFCKAPEGAVCHGMPEARIADLLDLAAHELGVAIAHLTPAQVEELVFVLAPRCMVLGPGAAPTLLAEARALFAFLGRAYGAPHAAGWQQVLDAKREGELIRRFADPTRYSPQKAEVMRLFVPKNPGRPRRPAASAQRRKAKASRLARRRNRR